MIKSTVDMALVKNYCKKFVSGFKREIVDAIGLPFKPKDNSIHIGKLDYKGEGFVDYALGWRGSVPVDVPDSAYKLISISKIGKSNLDIEMALVVDLTKCKYLFNEFYNSITMAVGYENLYNIEGSVIFTEKVAVELRNGLLKDFVPLALFKGREVYLPSLLMDSSALNSFEHVFNLEQGSSDIVSVWQRRFFMATHGIEVSSVKVSAFSKKTIARVEDSILRLDSVCRRVLKK